MAAYARRHYGIDSYRLRDPKVIVEHYTVTATFQQTFNTFAPDHPDPELHELPGHVRALRDRPRRHDLPARPALDHVPPHGRAELHGDRDRARRLQRRRVMRNARQLAASLRLTRWLRCRYGIGTNNVIGHSESALLAVPHGERRAAAHADARRHDARRRCARIGRKLARRALLSTLSRMRIVAAVCSCWPSGRGGRRRRGAKRPRLKAFASCKQLVDYARAGALRTDGGVGRDRPRGAAAGRRGHDAADHAAADRQRRATAPTAAPGAGRAATAIGGAVPDFSGTNMQEIGVDEPDILKTDGRRIFAVTDRTLRVIDVASGDGHRDARARRLRPHAAAARRPRAGDRRQGRRRRPRAGRPAGRADRRAGREHDDRHRDRRLAPRRRSCARWRCRAASSTRARTAPSRGW